MNCKSAKYLIIQAGGLGSRMESYTRNKPKCLLPYRGKTILEHLLITFTDKKVIIICDYLKDVLENYTKNILNRHDITFIEAKQKTTTAGLIDAMKLIKEDEPFILSWSDIMLSSFEDIDITKDIGVFITDSFKCRYGFIDGKIVKGDTDKNGILGLYIFKSKDLLKNIDESASFVGENLPRLKNLEPVKIEHALEIGTKETYMNLLKKDAICRFFNSITITEERVEKKCIDKNYTNLIQDEITWYRFLNDKVSFIPKLLNDNPLTISRIKGEHIFSADLDDNRKLKVLNSIINNLKTIHELDSKSSDIRDLEDIYYNKTFNRVDSIKTIIPYYASKEIIINNKLCLNPFHETQIDLFKSQIKELYSPVYNIIHGDCTFSNIIIKDTDAYFIDPRGSFGKSKIYGDKNYDWAKLYYSVNGNYDSINSKRFEVKVNNNQIELSINSNGFEYLSEYLINCAGMGKRIMLLQHALIWLSLTGYVKEDIDSVIYSFWKGVYEWNLLQD